MTTMGDPDLLTAPPAGPAEDTPADADLLARLAAGDDAAWRLVVSRFRRSVHRRAYRVGLDSHEVQDVEQRVWSRLWENARHVRDPRCLPGWIATTAHREALDAVERRRRTAERLGGTDDEAHAVPAPASADPLHSLLAGERSRMLRSALSTLPARQRLLLQAVAEGFSYAEISRRLVMPTGSIGPTRARAAARLRCGMPGLADL